MQRDLAPYAHVIDQGPFRKQLILETVEKAGYQMTDFDAVCGRGGLLRHIPSGTYAVSDQAIADVLDPPYGEHASNLGGSPGPGAGRHGWDSLLLCGPGLCG